MQHEDPKTKKNSFKKARTKNFIRLAKTFLHLHFSLCFKRRYQQNNHFLFSALRIWSPKQLFESLFTPWTSCFFALSLIKKQKTITPLWVVKKTAQTIKFKLLNCEKPREGRPIIASAIALPLLINTTAWDFVSRLIILIYINSNNQLASK